MLGCLMIGGVPEVTYLGTGGGPFNIGPARADRIIATFFLSENDGAATLNSVTIGGVSATLDYAPTVEDPMGFAHAVVPSGTTASISSSGAGAQASYMITGLANNTKFSDNATSGSSNIAQSLSVPSSFSVVLCCARGRTGTAPFTCTGSGTAASMVADATQNNGGGSNPAWVVGHAIAYDTDTVTITEVGSFSSGLGYSICFY